MTRLVLLEIGVGGGRPGRIVHIAIAGRQIRRGDLRQALEVRAGRLVQANRRAPVGDRRYGFGEVRNRIRLERHRSVAGDSARGQLHRVRNLLERLHGDKLGLAAATGAVAALRETVLRINRREMLVDDELDADARAAFFARLGEEDDVAIERHVQPLEQQHHHQRRRDIVLVVHGATAVDITAVARRAEGWRRPLLGIDIDDVRVRHEQERPLLAVPLQPRDDARPMWLERDDLNRNALLFEGRFEVVGRRLLVAGRVARIEAEQRLEVAERFGFRLGPIRRRRGLRGEDGTGGQNNQSAAKLWAHDRDYRLTPSAVPGW